MLELTPLPSIDPVNKVPPIYGGPVPAVAIRKVGNYAEAVDLEKNSTIAYSTNHAEVFQKAIDYVEKGGMVFIGKGKYYLETSIKIKYNGIRIHGAGGFGDYQLTADANVPGVYPKNLTVLVDNTDTGLDPMIQVGDGSKPIIGVQIYNLALLGKEPPYAGDTDWKSGAGIRVISARNGLVLEKISVYRKERGIAFYTTDPSSYSYLQNNEGFIVRDAMFAYCRYGITHESGSWWIADAVFENIRGYYVYDHIISSYGINNWIVNTVFRDIIAQASGWSGTYPIHVKCAGNVVFDKVFLDGNIGEEAKMFGGMRILLEDSEENGRCFVIIDNPVIMGANNKGIEIAGSKQGIVIIKNPYIGTLPNAKAPLGGLHGVYEYGIVKANSNAIVHVIGGWVNTELGDKSKFFMYFTSKDRIINVKNYTRPPEEIVPDSSPYSWTNNTPLVADVYVRGSVDRVTVKTEDGTANDVSYVGDVHVVLLPKETVEVAFSTAPVLIIRYRV